MGVWHEAGATRFGTVTLSAERTITVDNKVLTTPKIELTFQPAWVVRNPKTNEVDQGPGVINTDNLPPSIIERMLRHPDFGKEWKIKVDDWCKAKEKAGRLLPGLPKRKVDISVTAEQAEAFNRWVKETGQEAPIDVGQEDSGSLATQGVIGAGGRAVKQGKG